MAILDIYANVDAVDYGNVGDGSDLTVSSTRWVSFGPYAGGIGPNHFDLRNIKVGTSSGASDLFAPALTGMGDFDTWYGGGADPTFSGGVMSFNNTGDRNGVKDLGADYADIFVEFDIRIYSNDNDPDYHDIAAAGSYPNWDNGIYADGGVWQFDGPGNTFGSPIKDGTTWQTVKLEWSYRASPPPTATISAAPSSGCVGDTITITGSGFAASSALTATFDGESVVLSPAVSDGAGDVNSTFVVPSGHSGTGLSIVVTDASSGFGTTTFNMATHAVSFSPANGAPGDVITVTGTCWCPDTPITVQWTEGTFPLPGYFSRTLVLTPPDSASDGSINSTFVVPMDARPGDTAQVVVGDGGCSGTGLFSSFTVCENGSGKQYDGYSVPGLRAGTATETVPTGTLLDWTDTDTDFWMLFHRPSSAWSGTSFPPPDDSTTYPLEVHRFPKDGSAITVYPCGSDLAMHWDFDSEPGHGTVGCFLPKTDCGNGGINCTPGNTGYWWWGAWWFTGWRKRVLNARLATDGTDVWVAAIATETEQYPYISTLDTEVYGSGTCPTGCTMTIASQASQFVDLATVTSGFTTFVTSQSAAESGHTDSACGSTLSGGGTLYQKWSMFGKGTLGLSPERGNQSDGGDNYTGYYQQPKLVLFSLSGSAFSRIGDDPSQYVMGFGTSFYRDTTNSNNIPETQLGWLSLAASSAEPGVCHAVWSEQGAYGTRFKDTSGGHVNNSFDAWDHGSSNIGSRVSYSKWDSGALVSQNDLWTGYQDRRSWYYTSNPAYVSGNYTSGSPPAMNYTDQFEVKNDHGAPALILAFELLETHNSGNDPAVLSGAYYARYGSDVSTLGYYDLSSGSAALAQAFDTALLPTQADLQNVFTLNGEDPSPITSGPSSISTIFSGSNYLHQDQGSTGGMGTSRMYSDPTLSNTDVYGVSIHTDDHWTGTSSRSVTADYYRIPCDGAGAWDYIQGDRDTAISPTIDRWGTTVGVLPVVRYATAGEDFMYESKGIWAVGAINFPNSTWDRLDLVCDRWWEQLWFQGDVLPTYQGNSLYSGIHGSPVYDPDAGVVLQPGNHSTSSSTHVFGIISTPIVLTNCGCPSTGLHIWQYIGSGITPV